MVLKPDDVPGFRLNELGLYVPERRTRYSRPTCVDLFCGCGGFSLGMIQGGFQVVMGVDNEPAAAMTYLYNLGSYPLDMRFTSSKWEEVFEKALEKERKRTEKSAKKSGSIVRAFVSGGNPDRPAEWARFPVPHFYFGDVQELTGEMILNAIGLEIGELDCVVGGPPCQGFSRSNLKRSPKDPRNNLVFEFLRLVLEIRPKTMVMENVPEMANMVTPEGIPVIDAIGRVLEDGSFAAYDALKKSLLSTAGLGAILRRSRKTEKQKDGKRRKPLKREKAPDEQIELFA